MVNDVKRVYVEKKHGFDVESSHLLNEFKNNLKIESIKNLRILNRYDVSGVSDKVFNQSVASVFSENNQDNVFNEQLKFGINTFGVEYLPGQYDQRADSAAQCIQILTSGNRPIVKYAKIIEINGDISQNDFEKIKKYYINPVDSRETSLKLPLYLDENYPEAPDVAIFEGFTAFDNIELENFRKKMGFAMSNDDLFFCQNYFKNEEKRNPTITELKVIDTYWSDHCRHTTFLTKFNEIKFEKGKITDNIKDTYDKYVDVRKIVYSDKRNKDQCLMDIAVLSMKYLRKIGKLDDLEISDEINACSIEVDANIEGENEKWLVMFKNETHNHPTEIEPFGGAATCLGGAIRDPLSGRAYVYQAMRITGSGDPTVSLDETLAGKLPQLKITTEAAHGYSSYGNQIGLATGKVVEVYHERYRAKRMEIGAVIAGVPKENVKRENSDPGDIIILVGGRTGRDGCGGATGSSKEHDEESIHICGSEVQKGNPPEERKIQRLFRNKELSRMIKKCNDFGAGGVSVAIGELAESLEIDLDKVLKKYEGLDGTEIAISESQERMAVVIDPKDIDDFVSIANSENLETSVVARVTDSKRLVMNWRGREVLNISREFLDTNGVKQICDVYVSEPKNTENKSYIHLEKSKNEDIKKLWLNNLKDLNNASQKGLSERFDSTIGAGTVIMPFGGKYQLTPSEGMVAKLPVQERETNTVTIMSHGFDPFLSIESPYHGAQYAVIHSLAKIVAMGGDYKKTRLTLQEYFEKLNDEPIRWGKPFAALLGAFKAQMELEIPAIGGKDSMSGTFKDMDVPPTLVSFAVAVENAENIISPEFKKINSEVVVIDIKKNNDNLPDYSDLKNKYEKITTLSRQNKILSIHTIGMGGIGSAISNMSFGNKIGFSFDEQFDFDDLFKPNYGAMILEIIKIEDLDDIEYTRLGTTTKEPSVKIDNNVITIKEMIATWLKPLDGIFPVKEDANGIVSSFSYTKGNKIQRIETFAKPKIFIPVFPGTNCEYDTTKAFKNAGGDTDVFVFRNYSQTSIEDSIKEMARRINESQIIAIPGGFSAGDEPEGSGKFITAVFKNPLLKDAVMNLIKNRDGLMIGICNGFQALIKLGLLQHGEILELEENAPTLTYNKIGRHISTFVSTKITSNLSPWFNNCKVGDIHTIPISHGEGRFVANDDWITKLQESGQIAAQYVDGNGFPTYDGFYNPNGSIESIEAITSPDGRVLGKMGHSERIGTHLYKNISGNKDQGIFAAGIKYYL